MSFTDEYLLHSKNEKKFSVENAILYHVKEGDGS